MPVKHLIHYTNKAMAITPDGLERFLNQPEPAAAAIDKAMLEAHEHQMVSVDALAATGTVKKGKVAVVPIMGVLSQRPGLIERLFFGAYSVAGLMKTLDAIAADETIKTVILHLDTPGGSVSGIAEAAEKIKAMRATKHVVALADGMACSAGYWLAAQADEIVCTPSSVVGSVGVIAVHSDYSRAYEEAGITNTIVTYGKNKAEMSPYKPLDEEAEKQLQADVDYYGEMFVNAVASGRGISAKDVKNNFGGGRSVNAGPAKKAGMIDRIGTLDDILAKLGGGTAATQSGYSAKQNANRMAMAVID